MGGQVKGLYTLTENLITDVIPENQIFVPTGIHSIDQRLNCLEGGRTTLLTGRPGEGKTTVGHRLCLEAIDCGYKPLIVDGEHERRALVRNLTTKIIGNDPSAYTLTDYGMKKIKVVKKHIAPMISEWAKDKLYYYSRSDGEINNLNKLFDMYRWMQAEHGIDLVFLDNLMSLMEFRDTDKNENQIRFMDQCCNLAAKTGIHVVIVAHPNKTAAKGQSIDYFQVSGASELINMADNVLQVIRADKPEEQLCDGWIEIHKNRGYGDFLKVELVYDSETTALVEKGEAPKKLNWRNEGEQGGLPW